MACPGRPSTAMYSAKYSCEIERIRGNQTRASRGVPDVLRVAVSAAPWVARWSTITAALGREGHGARARASVLLRLAKLDLAS